MSTLMTTTVAREIVADRLRRAESVRLARSTRQTSATEVPEQPSRPAGVGWTRRRRGFRIVPAQ